jgi:hypothetical protein
MHYPARSLHSSCHTQEIQMPGKPTQAALTPEALAAEFDALMARSGVTVPPARRQTMIDGYADLRTQLALLHGRYSHVSEPSNVFRLSPVERG